MYYDDTEDSLLSSVFEPNDNLPWYANQNENNIGSSPSSYSAIFSPQNPKLSKSFVHKINYSRRLKNILVYILCWLSYK